MPPPYVSALAVGSATAFLLVLARLRRGGAQPLRGEPTAGPDADG